jgi:type VI secretion system secreted protein Hcp
MAVDYFLKITGIEGESQDFQHKGEIDILSWSWGEASSASAAHGGAGKVSMQDFHFTAKTSKASPKLFAAVASGQRFSSAVLTARSTGEFEQEFLKWTMTQLLVSSYQTAGNAANDTDRPTDDFSLNFRKISVEFRSLRSDGTLADPVGEEFDQGS